MSHAALASLQGALTEIYDLPVTPDVRDFLMTDRAGLGSVDHPRASDEQLIVAEDGDTLSMALYIDAAVLVKRVVLGNQHAAPQIRRDSRVRHPAIVDRIALSGRAQLRFALLHERRRRWRFRRQRAHVGKGDPLVDNDQNDGHEEDEQNALDHEARILALRFTP